MTAVEAWPDPELPAVKVAVAAPPAPVPAEGGTSVVTQPEGPDPNEQEAAAEQEGPAEPPKPSLLRLIVSDWKGEVKFGFEFGSGNNDRTRFSGGFNINKQYWGHRTQIYSEYFIATDNRGESENRLVSRFTQDWSTGGSKWSGVFLRVLGDADRFRDYDYRLNISTGANYQAYKDDETGVLFRVGGSARREFGARDEDIVPEGAFYINADHRISDTQRVDFALDYLPEIERPERYRLNTRANWNIDINPEAGLGLRLSINNRYDSRVTGSRERNDFDFIAYLIWNF